MREDYILRMALKFNFKTTDGKTYQCTQKQLIRLFNHAYNINFDALWDYMEHIIDCEDNDFIDYMDKRKYKKSLPHIIYVAEQMA